MYYHMSFPSQPNRLTMTISTAESLAHSLLAPIRHSKNSLKLRSVSVGVDDPPWLGVVVRRSPSHGLKQREQLFVTD